MNEDDKGVEELTIIDKLDKEASHLRLPEIDDGIVLSKIEKYLKVVVDSELSNKEIEKLIECIKKLINFFSSDVVHGDSVLIIIQSIIKYSIRILIKLIRFDNYYIYAINYLRYFLWPRINLYNHNLNNDNYISDYYIPSENDPIYPIGTIVRLYDERRRENICGEVCWLSDDKQKYRIKLHDGDVYPKEFSVYERYDAKVYKPKNLSPWRRNLKLCDLVDVYTSVDRSSDWFLGQIISINDETNELTIRVGDLDDTTTVFPIQTRSFAPAYSQSKGRLNRISQPNYHPLILPPIDQVKESKGHIVERPNDFYSKLYYFAVNTFLECNGILEIINMLKNNPSFTNLLLVQSTLTLFCRVLSNDYVNNNWQELLKILKEEFMKIPLDQLRNVSSHQLSDFLKSISFLHHRMIYNVPEYRKQRQAVIEELYQFYLPRFMSSPSLETRLNAFQMIFYAINLAENIQRCENDIIHDQMMRCMMFVDRGVNVTPQKLSKWIKDNKILENIFIGELCHKELIKKSTRLFFFLSQYRLFDDYYYKLILSGLNYAGGVNKDVIYYVISEFVTEDFPNNYTLNFYSLISSLPPKDFNQISLQLLFRLCVKLPFESIRNAIDKLLDVLYNNTELQKDTLNKIWDVLDELMIKYETDGFTLYVYRWFLNLLQQHKATYICFYLYKEILSTRESPNEDKEVSLINESNIPPFKEIFSLLLEELKMCNESIQKITEEDKVPIELIRNTNVILDIIQLYIDIGNCDVKIINLIDTLWDLLVKNNPNPSGVCRWIDNVCTQHNLHEYIISKFNDKDIQRNVSNLMLRMLINHFTICNICADNLQEIETQNKSKRYRLLRYPFQHEDIFDQILSNCEDNISIKEITKFYTLLYKTSHNNQAAQRASQLSFINRCFNALNTNPNKNWADMLNVIVNNLSRDMNIFLHKYRIRNRIVEIKYDYSPNMNNHNNNVRNSNSIAKLTTGTIKVYEICPLSVVRQYFAEKFGKNENDIVISYQQDIVEDNLVMNICNENNFTIQISTPYSGDVMEIDDDNDNSYISSSIVMTKEMFMKMKDPNLLHVIAYEKKYYSILFDLLSKCDNGKNNSLLNMVWNIINIIPTIPDYYFQFYSILFDEKSVEIDWDKIYSKSYNILLYQLQILDSLLFPQIEYNNFSAWTNKFYKLNGFVGLYKLFLNNKEWYSDETEYKSKLSTILINLIYINVYCIYDNKKPVQITTTIHDKDLEFVNPNRSESDYFKDLLKGRQLLNDNSTYNNGNNKENGNNNNKPEIENVGVFPNKETLSKLVPKQYFLELQDKISANDLQKKIIEVLVIIKDMKKMNEYNTSWIKTLLDLYQLIFITYPNISDDWIEILPPNLLYNLFLLVESQDEYYLHLVDTISIMIPFLNESHIILLIQNLFESFNLDTHYNCTSYGLHCYFALLCRLLAKLNPTHISTQLKRLFSLDILKQILSTDESDNTIFNQIKAGYIKVFSTIIDMNKSLLEVTNDKGERECVNLCKHLIYKCLFGPLGKKLCEEVPLFRDSQIRMSCLILLGVLLKYEDNQLFILNYFYDFIYDTPELKRSCRSSLRNKDNYTGLVNPCCLCYMNSLVQQFFMIHQFRESILNSKSRYRNNDNKKMKGKNNEGRSNVIDVESNNGKEKGNNNQNQCDIEDDMLYQLQRLFLYLKYTNRSAYNPVPFIRSFKDESGNPTDYTIQQDAFEFLQNLTDKIEEELKGQGTENLVKELFSGKINNQNRCHGSCGIKTNSSETSYFISLDVEGHKNLNESLTEFVSGTTISDYNCETCKKKVDITRRASFQDLSNIVIIHLKRFKWNYDTFEREKINDRFEFPLSLDLYPFSSEALGDVLPTDKRDRSYYLYKLKGIVVHSGNADSGHYYSFIQDRNTNNWYQFNDESVTPFNIDEDLESECYGNETSNDYYRQVGRCRNAYVLIYEREKFLPFEIKACKVLPQYIEDLKNEISEDNNTSLREYYITTGNFENFMLQFLNTVSNSTVIKSEDYYKLLSLMGRYITHHLVNHKISMCCTFLNKLSSLFNDNDKYSYEYMKIIIEQPIINKKLFFKCYDKDVRSYFASFMSVLMINSMRYEIENKIINPEMYKKDLSNEDNKPLIYKFLYPLLSEKVIKKNMGSELYTELFLFIIHLQQSKYSSEVNLMLYNTFHYKDFIYKILNIASSSTNLHNADTDNYNNIYHSLSLFICCCDTGSSPPLSPSKQSNYLYRIKTEDIFRDIDIELLINPISNNCPGIQNLFRHLCYNNRDGSVIVMANVLLHFWKHQPFPQYMSSYKSLCNILFTLNDELDDYRMDLFLISKKGIYDYIKDHSLNRPDIVINTMVALFELSSQIPSLERKLRITKDRWNFIDSFYLNRTTASPAISSPFQIELEPCKSLYTKFIEKK